jgi:hypothetical protein
MLVDEVRIKNDMTPACSVGVRGGYGCHAIYHFTPQNAASYSIVEEQDILTLTSTRRNILRTGLYLPHKGGLGKKKIVDFGFFLQEYFLDGDGETGNYESKWIDSGWA